MKRDVFCQRTEQRVQSIVARGRWFVGDRARDVGGTHRRQLGSETQRGPVPVVSSIDDDPLGEGVDRRRRGVSHNPSLCERQGGQRL